MTWRQPHGPGGSGFSAWLNDVPAPTGSAPAYIGLAFIAGAATLLFVGERWGKPSSRLPYVQYGLFVSTTKADIVVDKGAGVAGTGLPARIAVIRPQVMPIPG